MVDVARRRVTYAEYVAIANDSDIKYEYVAGEGYRDGGWDGRARPPDRPCGGADSTARSRASRASCCPRTPDIRDFAPRIRSTYPDLHVGVREPERDTDDDHAIVNPTVFVEVLSYSTAGHDRTEKFAAYRRLPSLREYVLISQRERRVEVYRRARIAGGQLDEHLTGSRLRLESLAIELSVDELYVDRRSASSSCSPCVHPVRGSSARPQGLSRSGWGARQGHGERRARAELAVDGDRATVGDDVVDRAMYSPSPSRQLARRR